MKKKKEEEEGVCNFKILKYLFVTKIFKKKEEGVCNFKRLVLPFLIVEEALSWTVSHHVRSSLDPTCAPFQTHRIDLPKSPNTFS